MVLVGKDVSVLRRLNTCKSWQPEFEVPTRHLKSDLHFFRDLASSFSDHSLLFFTSGEQKAQTKTDQ